MFRKTLLAFALTMAGAGFGKNLDGRVGFGLTHLDFTGGPAVSLKYFHTNMQATTFLAGFNTETTTYQLGIKTVRHVLLEENMNLYIGVGGFLLNNTLGAGAEFNALGGGEFFLSGLPNLGFQFEVGIGLRSLRTTSFRSVGGAFATGAVHYYF